MGNETHHPLRLLDHTSKKSFIISLMLNGLRCMKEKSSLLLAIREFKRSQLRPTLTCEPQKSCKLLFSEVAQSSSLFSCHFLTYENCLVQVVLFCILEHLFISRDLINIVPLKNGAVQENFHSEECDIKLLQALFLRYTRLSHQDYFRTNDPASSMSQRCQCGLSGSDCKFQYA